MSSAALRLVSQKQEKLKHQRCIAKDYNGILSLFERASS